MSNATFWSLFLIGWVVAGFAVAWMFGGWARGREAEPSVFMRDLKDRKLVERPDEH